MRFLDLDLDFFLNKNAYGGGNNDERLSSEYKPRSFSWVRHFLEDRCGLSPGAPVQGRTVERHDGILDFWHDLIESGSLKAPFDVVHVDAHPDLWVGGGLYRVSEYLHLDPEHALEMLKNKSAHAGNYLTFAIARGWIKSLLWVSLHKRSVSSHEWDADARAIEAPMKNVTGDHAPVHDNPDQQGETGVLYIIIPWDRFRTNEAFDYMALSKSPNFTPPESDALIPVIEEYMKQI